MWNEWRLCDINIVSIKIFESTELTPLIMYQESSVWEFPLQVILLKYLDATKHQYYVTFDGGESYKFKSSIDRGSIYYPFYLPTQIGK